MDFLTRTFERLPCVLLVEDDDAVRRSLQLLLRSRGYEVKAYPSAGSLAQDLGARACGLLIADLMLPDTDAVRMLGQFRAAGWNGKSILISGNVETGLDELARSAGFDAALTKPISESVLVRTVEELMSGQQAF